MRSLILGLLAVFLIKPCLAQQMSETFGLSVLAMSQPYSSLNSDFDDISKILATKTQIKVIPIPQETAHLLEEQALIAGFEKTVYSLPVQMKTIPINEGQAQVFLNSIKEAQTNLEISSSKIIMYAGLGNGGGGAVYQNKMIGFQEHLRGQAQKAINFVNKLQGIEVNPYSSKLTYWTVTANDNEIEEFLSAVYSVENSNPQEIMIYADKIKAQYENGRHFKDENLLVPFFDDNTLAYYGANMKELVKQAISVSQADSASKFYQTNDHFQNGIIFVVGHGNGGGGTYIK